MRKLLLFLFSFLTMVSVFSSCEEDVDEPLEFAPEIIYRRYSDDLLTSRKETYIAETIEGYGLYYTQLTETTVEVAQKPYWHIAAFDTVVTGRLTIPAALYDSDLDCRINVIAVGKKAFEAYKKMDEIVLPNSVSVIKDCAFAG